MGGLSLPGFWFIAYHRLIWLYLYLSSAVDGLTPTEPFTPNELDPNWLTTGGLIILEK